MSYDPQPRMRVVCVDEVDPESLAENPGVTFPNKGTVYTIKKAYPGEDGPYLRLSELDQSVVANGESCWACWWYRHFKPLDERRLDVFRTALAPTPKQRERVSA